MGALEEIRELLKKFTAGAIQTFPASVVSVDQEKLTAIVKPGKDPEIKVRLKSAINESSGRFLLIPKIDSTVLVTLIQNDTSKAFVSAYDEIDKIQVVIGDQSFEMDQSGFKHNSGNNGGLCITPELKDQLAKMTARIDAIIGVLSTGANGGGTVVFAGMTEPEYIQAMANAEDFSQIENEKVKH